MFRSILGFAVLAFSHVGSQVDLGILGSLVGLAMTVMWLAFILLRRLSRVAARQPRTADRIRDMIKDVPQTPLKAPGRGGSSAPCTIFQRLPLPLLANECRRRLPHAARPG